MMILTASERLFLFNLEADAAFDVSANREAKAVFSLFFQHLRSARLKKSFFQNERARDLEFKIEYLNAWAEPLRYPPINQMHIISCLASAFCTIERAKELRVMWAMHDDVGFQRSGVYYKKTAERTPTLILYDYVQPEYADEGAEFPYDDYQLFLKHTAKSKTQTSLQNTFVHEYTHFIDDMRARQKSSIGNRSRIVQPEENYQKYINDLPEINARYAEWIVNIVESFSRLLAVKKSGIKGRFPNFKPFWDFYWTHPGYVPSELRIYADKSTRQRLARRLYKFWEWACSQDKKTLNEDRAVKFVKNQIFKEFRGERDAPDRFESGRFY